MREDVAVSQPAVRDRQKGGISETRSEASKRRAEGGLGCSCPDSLRPRPARAKPGKRDMFQNPHSRARGDDPRVSLTAPLGLGLLGLASSVASDRNGEYECQLKAE